MWYDSIEHNFVFRYVGRSKATNKPLFYLNTLFSGHDQCGGEVIEKNGKKFKLFYGMSSCTAMKKYAGETL